MKSFPLITLKILSNVFGKLTTDCQQISRTRVVVSTSLVLSYLLDRERFPVCYPTPQQPQSAPVAGDFFCCIFPSHSCNLNPAQQLLKKYKEETSDRLSPFATMEPKIDRRTHKRVKLIKWPAKVLIKDKSIDGITRNISTHGAFIYYVQPHGKNLPLQLHKVVDLIIEVPGVAPLFICAEVIWSDILTSDEKNTLLGVGLHFIEVPDKDSQFLHDFVTVHTDPMLNRTYKHLWSNE